MNDVSSSLTSILAEAQALLHDLSSATPSAQFAPATRALRLLLAAECCHRALAMTTERTAGAGRRPSTRRAGKHGLSPRELEVLRLMAAGCRDREIAELLLVSPRTASTHVTAILNKLGAESRTAAATYAIRVGLV
ncbi:MAG: hypothetical protein QOF33_2047 [Thermomicrobiales bacterium]|jgi:DNA-binding NarL/FixJ family response regulator|nr:hypothetical protein [Thermomicrobiales bacterium]MEA2583962.1 hypothetical protein [Thermomicrobiales bacterium]